MAQLYLASASPRRAELLTQLGIQFELVLPNIEERRLADELPAQYVTRLALQKARAGEALTAKDKPVLGADTIVVCHDQVLEKPKDFNDACRIWRLLSGARHQVMTAVALVRSDLEQVVCVQTDVEFASLSDTDMQSYWASGEPQDKAGAYGIQGLGGQYVVAINGSYSAVVGLPLYQTNALIKQFIQ
ncbi:Maf family protein [Motilimonas eburnea]|uniref:Maf family protein n=1 Tax=Motilimonas eburnea TaxID=1737488 RepID=UPI001E56631D|nr:Maf family protein [Motilimonas eburnea]MCE2572117.1 Maf-like protein [Motilimonas eburnea]